MKLEVDKVLADHPQLSTGGGYRPTDTRRVGATAVDVSVLGFGGAGIGGLYAPVADAEALDTIARARAAGVRYFDTAPYYGFGASEARLGAALREAGTDADAVVVSTKVGRVLRHALDIDATTPRHGFVSAAPFEPELDYSYDGVLRSWESSMERLGRSRIDILLVHDLGARTHGGSHAAHLKAFLDGGYRALRGLRDAGAVGAIGLGVNEWEVCEQALAHADLDCVLLAGRYTLLEQSAVDTFLPLCERRGVSVIVGAPFSSGVLAVGTRSGRPMRHDYESAPAEIVERVRRLEAVCDDFAVPLSAAALQFPLAHPRVCSVIPGLVGAAQVERAAADIARPIPAAFWRALRDQGLLAAAAPIPECEPDAARSPGRSEPSTPGPLLLHDADNVLVCVAELRPGDTIVIDGEPIVVSAGTPLGHKIARRDLHPGEKVYRYGAPVGRMTAFAAKGAHVHVHNMASDYIATHARSGGADGAR